MSRNGFELGLCANEDKVYAEGVPPVSLVSVRNFRGFFWDQRQVYPRIGDSPRRMERTRFPCARENTQRFYDFIGGELKSTSVCFFLGSYRYFASAPLDTHPRNGDPPRRIVRKRSPCTRGEAEDNARNRKHVKLDGSVPLSR